MISQDALFRHAPAPSDTPRVLRTGVRALDGLLGPRGVPSGHITTWVGAASCGKTGLLRSLIEETRRTGVSVAWIDANSELMATDWADDAPGRLWVVRPPRRDEAAFCAELLLDTASFGLVVIDGAPSLSRSRSVRLQRLARHAGAAVIVVGSTRSQLVGGRVQRRFAFSTLPTPAVDETIDSPLERALARRAPLVWRISGIEGKFVDGEGCELVLAEPISHRLVVAIPPPDRPSTRHVGARRGRGRR